jgi:hypothetical protein
MKRWAALALALLLVAATYYPKPAAAQHPEWLINTVRYAFEELKFVFKDSEKFLSKLYPGINLPTGYDILNFYGGEKGVRALLNEIFKLPETYAFRPEAYDAIYAHKDEIIDAVIARFSTYKPIDRRMDLVMTIAGRNMDFLIEIKSVNDFTNKENVIQTLSEALYDAYMAAKGDPVIWVTQGRPGKIWGQKLLNFLSERGVGVSTSLSDKPSLAQAAESVAQRVYKISLTKVIEGIDKYINYEGIASFFKRNPQLVAFIVLVGADVIVSIWQPADENQAMVKMVLQDVIRTGWVTYTMFTTAKGLGALALSIAVGSGVGAAVAAVSLLPTIVTYAHAAITGQRPSPHVTVTKVTIDGVELTFALVDPPDVWVPKKVVVSRGGEVLVAVEVSRYTQVMGCQSKETWAGGRLSVWCCGSGCSATITSYGSYNERQGRCVYSISWSRTSSVSLSLGALALGRAPQPTTSYWSSRTLLYCEPEPQPPPRPVAAGGAPAQKPQEKYLLVEVRRWLSEVWERAVWCADQLASLLAQLPARIAAEPVLAVPIAAAVAAAVLVAVKRRR